MTRLDWQEVGKRYFETGVDRGVLYVDGQDGVSWIGLTSVSESPRGGEVTPYYIDGVKYLNVSAATEYEATINAFTYPDEFEQCQGNEEIEPGLFSTQGFRKSFGLSYRSKIGNDTQGSDHAYKIHLVYHALAEPSSIDYASISSEVSPADLSWNIKTRAPVIPGRRPSSHFVIDSRKTSPSVLSALEDILYGTSTTAPRLPLIPELISVFGGTP